MNDMQNAVSDILPGIIISQARVQYQGKILFANMNLTLAAGQWTCLLGPSGVGKTSLLRLIAGLSVGAEATANISISEENIKNNIAYMAQTDLLLPWLSTIDNVLIPQRLVGKRCDAAAKLKAQALLEQVGLADAVNKKPHELSGGMRQRVALARTLYMEKSIVLMDEPFASLDAVTKWNLQNLTANMLQHKTVLLITHDPLEALRLGHYIYVLSGSPAVCSDALILKNPTPRELNDAEVQYWHQELLMRLQQAQL